MTFRLLPNCSCISQAQRPVFEGMLIFLLSFAGGVGLVIAALTALSFGIGSLL
jgi:hypothetical protein